MWCPRRPLCLFDPDHSHHFQIYLPAFLASPRLTRSRHLSSKDPYWISCSPSEHRELPLRRTVSQLRLPSPLEETRPQMCNVQALAIHMHQCPLRQRLHRWSTETRAGHICLLFRVPVNHSPRRLERGGHEARTNHNKAIHETVLETRHGYRDQVHVNWMGQPAYTRAMRLSIMS